MSKSRVIRDDPNEHKHPIRRDGHVVTLAFQIAEEFGLPLGSVWLLNRDGSKADSHTQVGDWLNDYNDWDLNLLSGVLEMISRIEGKACVNLDVKRRVVHACRRIHELEVDESSVQGQCDWIEPEHARPEELTEGLTISCDCLEIGPDWWHDTYFDWYLVFRPELVARSLAGDHSWVDAFLDRISGADA